MAKQLYFYEISPGDKDHMGPTTSTTGSSRRSQPRSTPW